MILAYESAPDNERRTCQKPQCVKSKAPPPVPVKAPHAATAPPPVPVKVERVDATAAKPKPGIQAPFWPKTSMRAQPAMPAKPAVPAVPALALGGNTEIQYFRRPVLTAKPASVPVINFLGGACQGARGEKIKREVAVAAAAKSAMDEQVQGRGENWSDEEGDDQPLWDPRIDTFFSPRMPAPPMDEQALWAPPNGAGAQWGEEDEALAEEKYFKPAPDTTNIPVTTGAASRRRHFANNTQAGRNRRKKYYKQKRKRKRKRERAEGEEEGEAEE